MDMKGMVLLEMKNTNWKDTTPESYPWIPIRVDHVS
jgi:hypothetical protein